jgi:hypothetical protein
LFCFFFINHLVASKKKKNGGREREREREGEREREMVREKGERKDRWSSLQES